MSGLSSPPSEDSKKRQLTQSFPPPLQSYMKSLKSCSDFSGELKKVYLKLTEMKNVTSEFAVASKKLLNTPLPVAYEGTAHASGSNVAPVVTVGGGAFDSESMSGSNTNVGQALENDVLVPMKKWLDTFKSVEASVKSVEDLRLEVDSRRHTVADLSAQIDKLRAKLNTGADAKVEAKMEDTIKTLQHKEAKLTLTLDKFTESSTTLKNNLNKLIESAKNTKYYLMVAFKEQAKAYQDASAAIGDVPAPSDSVGLSKLDIADPPASPSEVTSAEGGGMESPVPGSPVADD